MKKFDEEFKKGILDTYWSDHCRHTTFETSLSDIKIEDPEVKAAFDNYMSDRVDVYGAEKASKRSVTLMDLATINMKRQKKLGNLPEFVDDDIENNACTIRATVDGEAYQILFKNETHNHPTEIDPYFGAATALGGCIRDVMSGRAKSYQSIRVSGAANVLQKKEDTMPGKLPQKFITKEAARGFSHYARVMQLPPGVIREYFHPGYVAKRLECGFVAGAASESSIVKSEPVVGDYVLLIGSRTGREGVGAATNSSSVHDKAVDETTIESSPFNAELEFKIQKLFDRPEFSILVKKCNDFGAGGISVAVLEMADSIDIDLSAVPLKSECVTAMEMSLSETQERMAVCINPKDFPAIQKMGKEEGLEVSHIATVTGTGYVRYFHKGELVMELSRELLDSTPTKAQSPVVIKAGGKATYPTAKSFTDLVKGVMADMNVACQGELRSLFNAKDTQGSVMLVPKKGNKTTATFAAHGFDPFEMEASPFHGAKAAVVESLAKLLAMGADYKNAYLTFQEYFPSQKTPEKWGNTMAALLGANEIAREYKVAAIGGKDSMSGTYKDIDVPPTLISFALVVGEMKDAITHDFKQAGSTVSVVSRENWEALLELMRAGKVLSAWALGFGGMIEGVAKMSFPNRIGFEFADGINLADLAKKNYGDIIVETASPIIGKVIGKTIKEKELRFGSESVSIQEAIATNQSVLKNIWK